MTAAQIALQVHPQHASYDDIRRTAQRAEDIGVDVVYNWDHFYPLYGPEDGAHFECWTMLGAWAEQTERIKFGALVTCNSYRNPQLLADMARTVDHISGGRLIFGIGSGWFERDYDEYGYDFGTAVGRLDILRDAMPVIEDRWSKLNPGPVNGKIPVLIGGTGEKKTLRIVATHADIWHGFGDVEKMAHKTKVLDDWCAKLDRDPSEILRSVGLQSAEAGMAVIDDYYELGFREYTVGLNGPDYDFTGVQALLDWRDAKNAG